MAEELIISKGSSKEELYKTLYLQLESLVENEDDLIANMANITSALKETFDFSGLGFIG